MNVTDRKYLMQLLSETVSWSTLPKSVQRSTYFNQLLVAEILIKERKGSGWIVYSSQKENLNQFIKTKFPEEAIEENTKTSNIKAFRNSKAAKTESKRIVFFRGSKICLINNEEVDLSYYDEKFGLFTTRLDDLKVDKLCFVENLDSFLKAEQVISSDYVFIHAYGRIGKKLLQRITANEILVFSDYDFVGLREYLTIKSHCKNTRFFIPENYDKLFKTFSRKLSIHKEKQTVSNIVANSKEEMVIKIREQVLKTQYFLEQEAIF